MFKKIFHTSTGGKLGESLKSSLATGSSTSGESEIVTASEVPRPEKRFFLRRPLKIRPGFDEHHLSYFRTFDPFDIKLSLKRSSSFPFKEKLEDADHCALKLPRSKSVHFAENLATYHEFKPNLSLSFSDLESTFEEFCRMKRNKAAGGTQDDDADDDQSTEGGEEDDDDDESDSHVSQDDEDEVADNQSEASVQEETSNSDQSGSLKKSQKKNCPKKKRKKNNRIPNIKATKGMKLAGQNLKSMFSGTAPVVEALETKTNAQKTLTFDNSDSTDVELIPETKRDKECEYLYPIYEQICDLKQQKAKEFTEGQLIIDEIRCGMADIGDIVGGFRDQLEVSNAEVVKLRHTLQQTTHDLEVQRTLTSVTRVDFAKYKESQKKQEQEKDQHMKNHINEVEAKVTSLENENKTKTEVEEKLSSTQKEVNRLLNHIQQLEALQHLESTCKHAKENEKLHAQINQERKDAGKMQKFQETEKLLLQTELEKAQAQAIHFANDTKEKTLVIKNLESALKAHKAAKEQQFNDASLMIQDMGQRYEEKKRQIAKMTEALENIQPPPHVITGTSNTNNSSSNNERTCLSSHSDSSKRKPTVVLLKSELDHFFELVGNIQNFVRDLQKQDAVKTRQLHELSQSNNIAVDTLAMLIKGSFEALTPIFDKDCADQFTQMYYEFSQLEVLSDSSKAIVMVLCTFILNSQRELLRLHQKNEHMLETEIHDRLKYQQQVLDSFTRIVRQVMDTSRTSATRISGIRCHSLPKNRRHVARH